MVDMDRYARHISLPDVGIEGQRLINKSRILVIGAGGLGRPVLLYLAAAGVGEIGIIDDDLVDLSNLQRQIIHAESNIGTSKVESAKAQILSINSTIKITTWNARLSPDNAQEILIHQQYADASVAKLLGLQGYAYPSQYDLRLIFPFFTFRMSL